MAVKMNVEIVNLPQLVKKLGPELIKEDIDRAIGDTADDALGPLRTLIPRSSKLGGHLVDSLASTRVSDRGGLRSQSTGSALSGVSAAYVVGNWYGRFPDRGTRYIRARHWSRKARTQVKPQADANLKAAGDRIAKKWGR